MMEAGANFNALHYFLPILIRLFFLVKGCLSFNWSIRFLYIFLPAFSLGALAIWMDGWD
jgi:hypothetical protein